MIKLIINWTAVWFFIRPSPRRSRYWVYDVDHTPIPCWRLEYNRLKGIQFGITKLAYSSWSDMVADHNSRCS